MTSDLRVERESVCERVRRAKETWMIESRKWVNENKERERETPSDIECESVQ